MRKLIYYLYVRKEQNKVIIIVLSSMLISDFGKADYFDIGNKINSY